MSGLPGRKLPLKIAYTFEKKYAILALSFHGDYRQDTGGIR